MCYSIFETPSFRKENLVCTRLTRRVYFSKKSFRRQSDAGESPYKGKFEKVSLIKQLNSSFLFGADAFRGNTRSHPEHDG